MMQIKKVVYFLEEYFNERDFQRFGIETLRESGFDVEVWNFTSFLATKDYQENTKPPDEIKWEKHIVFRGRKEALKRISHMSNTYFVISFIHFNYKSLPVYRMLTRKRIPYGVFLFALLMGLTPAGAKTRVYRRFKKMLRQPWRMIDFVMKKWLEAGLPLEPFGVMPASVVFAQAEKYLMPNGFPANSQSEVLFAHSFDYDIYLREKGEPVPADESIGVFLDEYLPFHTDYHFTGDKPQVTPEEYYPKLCNFFDYLERTLGVKVVIAAHPRSHYDEKHNDFFEGRPVLRGKTLELVRKSGFVLLHNSTAINYAVLFRKPMIFFTTNGVNRSLIDDPSIERLAGYFEKEAHNLDYGMDIDFEKELKVDTARYDLYKHEYIKKADSEEAPFWQIVANRLKKGF